MRASEYELIKFVNRNLKHLQNHPKFIRTVHWKIVRISHDVCKTPGQKGHDKRQEIRYELWEFVRRNFNIKL